MSATSNTVRASADVKLHESWSANQLFKTVGKLGPPTNTCSTATKLLFDPTNIGQSHGSITDSSPRHTGSNRNTNPGSAPAYRIADVQLWFARDGGVPIRDQLATQFMLAISSGELEPGRRLPSTRAVAKRFGLNVNTVSAAYQQLETLGWVESIRGSGVYVRARQNELQQGDVLDRFVLPFVRSGRVGGFSAKALRDRVDYWLAMRPERFVFVHPEPELRAIVCQELQSAMSWAIEHCGVQPSAFEPYLGDSVFVTTPSKQRIVRDALPPEVELIAIESRQVGQIISRYLPIPANALLAIASGWQGFLDIARTVLTAAGCDSETLLFRHTSANGWDRGLESASVVVCDSIAAQRIRNRFRTIVFHLLSDGSIARLKTFERFYRG